jgi:hypothetical protein
MVGVGSVCATSHLGNTANSWGTPQDLLDLCKLDMSGEKFLPGDSRLLRVENPAMRERVRAREVAKPCKFSAKNLRDTRHLSTRIPGDSGWYSRTWKGVFAA